MNCVAAVLLFPAASVNVLAATSIVVAPAALGVKVAVYTVELVAEKLLIAPPDTVMSAAAKLVVASLEVKVTVSVASLVVAPSLTALEPSVAVMVMVGAVLSIDALYQAILSSVDEEERISISPSLSISAA